MTDGELSFAEGDTVAGRFELKQQLTPGGTAAAWVAQDLLSDEVIVCKIAFDPIEEGRSWFKAQYQKLVRLRTLPSVAGVRGYFEHGDERRPVLALEYVVGPTLGDWCVGRTFSECIVKLAEVLDAIIHVHRVGMRHGDVAAGNILVRDEIVVLIDPYTEGAKTEFKALDDLTSMVRLCDQLLARFAGEHERRIRRLVQLLESERSTQSPSLGAVAAQFRVEAESVRATSVDAFDEIARAHISKVEAAHEQYLMNCKVRRSSFASLCDRIEEKAKKLRGETQRDRATDAERLKKELEVEVNALGDYEYGQATFRVEAAEFRLGLSSTSGGFRKPWAYGEGIVAKCEAQLVVDGNILPTTLRLNGAELEPVWEYKVHDRWRRLDDDWLHRRFLLLLGRWTSLVEVPLVIGGDKKDPDSRGADIALENGDIKIVNGDVALVHGLDNIFQSIGNWLRTPVGSWKAKPTYGSPLATAFAVPPNERRVVLSRVLEAFLKIYGAYFDVLTMFDVCFSDPPAKTCFIDIEVFPVGKEPARRSYELNF